MKKIIIMLLAAFPLFLTSCASSRFFSQSASGIRPIALVEPYSYITDAVGDWTTDYLENVSRANREIVTAQLNSIGLPVEKTVSLGAGVAGGKDSELSRWLSGLETVGAKNARDLVIPGAIRDAVRASGCRYGLVITDVGFLKNDRQKSAEQAVDVGMAVVDFLIHSEISVGSGARVCQNGIFALIFDNQSGEVVWYGAQPRRDKKNPVDGQAVGRQLRALFKDFL